MPGVAAQAAFGLVAQLTQLAAAIGLVLVTQAATGSLALAGVTAGAMSVGVGAARPVQGRLIDRRGPRPVLLASAALHVGALLGLVAAAKQGVPGGVLVALAAAAGLGLPPVSTCMRVEWGRRAPAEVRTAAYSLVYLTQELAILTGPLLLAVLVAVSSAALALIVVTLAAGAGTLAFTLAVRVGRDGPGPAARPGGVLRDQGMRVLLAIVALVGAVFGALEVSLPALAIASGRPALSGVLAAALSLGGIVGAVAYGTRPWSARPARRLVVLLTALGLALAPLGVLGWLPPGPLGPGPLGPGPLPPGPPGPGPLPGWLVLVGLMLCAAGIALNPALTTSSLLVDEVVPASPAEAFGWLSTALGLGTAAGGALTGVVAEQRGAPVAMALAPLLAFGAAGLARAARGRLTQIR